MPDRAQVVVATTNPGKIREISGILDGLTTNTGTRIDLVSLDAFPGIVEPEETGLTFAENARLKARYYARATGLACVADDSGLEIDAIDNQPGVHSARWHGTDYQVKFQKIYELIAARGQSGSPARFVCHVALAAPDGLLFETEGVVHGRIADAPRGTNGFGYDPVFFYPPFGCTLAEIDLERKATISHRGQAIAALRDYLKEHPVL
jgi:XTP/dITP diphosphohydrolase